MKNKEKIQILESRLNIHSELLDKIITKLELDNEPQLKQLDHSVFDGMDIDYMFAAVDGGTGRAYAYEEKPHVPVGKNYWRVLSGMQQPIAYVYDTSNWQSSLIERETNELTGSELCKAMLARGDKYVMCQCWCSSYADIEQVMDIVSGFAFEEDKKTFAGVSHNWDYAVPVNNQGDPLTSSDVGL